jgi:sugar (pentulose or hexulose) kinase
MKTKVIAIFDIGKTNKKLLLFDKQLNVVFQSEKEFPVILDEDDFECDDIQAIETWIIDTVRNIICENKFSLIGINFSTYGASLMFVDAFGNRLTSLYNYLKPMPDHIPKELYEKYGGENLFTTQTASPAMKMLNSGLQILWLKKSKPELFNLVHNILHFPQYLSFMLTKKAASDYTSIGCHTALWDFQHCCYHKWLSDESISLLNPVGNEVVHEISLFNKNIPVGIGIHDSSASLAPYIIGSPEKFILLSTGTWCISMNPFNSEPLTSSELKNDTLCYMSINQKPVKSSRFFLGHIHDLNAERIGAHFNSEKHYYRNIKSEIDGIQKLAEDSMENRVFFKTSIPDVYTDNAVDLT